LTEKEGRDAVAVGHHEREGKKKARFGPQEREGRATCAGDNQSGWKLRFLDEGEKKTYLFRDPERGGADHRLVREKNIQKEKKKKEEEKGKPESAHEKNSLHSRLKQRGGEGRKS